MTSTGHHIASIAFLGVLLGACSLGTDGRGLGVMGELKARQGATGRVQPFTSLTGLLENVDYRMPGRPTGPLTEAVVVGEVVDVEPGRGFRVEGDDAPGGIETDFDDPRALWRTVHVSVAAESVVSGTVGEQLLVGFAFDPDVPIAQVEADFRSFGRILLFLNRSPVFAYDPSVYGTVFDGGLLGLVDDGGDIQLPVLEDTEEADLLEGASTVDELREAAKQPRRVIELDASGMPAE
jgi:hypothetical protein